MAWYNSAWNNRIKVTVLAAEVDADLTDFPVYVDLNDLPASFHTNCNQTDARDIRVTTSDGSTEVPREVVFYDAATDTGELHFKGNVDSDTNTDFYIYYNNDAATEPAVDATYGRDNVWSNNYIGVWHLHEAVNNDADGYKDSTGNGYDGTGTSMSTAASASVLGNGQTFDGSADYIAANGGEGGNAQHTISMWMKTTEASATDVPFGEGRTSTTVPIVVLQMHSPSNDNFKYMLRDDANFSVTATDTSGVFNDGNFHYWVGVRDASNAIIYRDGANPTSQSLSTLGTITLNTRTIGALIRTALYGSSAATIDECRMSSVARSSTWISTEYSNQSTPGSFYTIGSDEIYDSNWYDSNWNYRVKVTVLATKVDADLEDYPVYVDLNDLPTTFHLHCNQTDGRDIRVTTSDGVTEVPREVVFYTAASDTGELHFKGDLDSDTDTDFYIYYGNSSASDYAADATYGKENVWNSNYKGVWHLQETGNGTASEYKDSTSNDNHGTGGSSAYPACVDTAIGKGADFDGSNDFIDVADSATLEPADISIEAYATVDGNGSHSDGIYLVEKGIHSATPYMSYGIVYNATTDKFGFLTGTTTPDYDIYENDSTFAPEASTYVHIFCAFDGSTKKIIVNNSKKEKSYVKELKYGLNTGETLHIGKWGYSTYTRQYDGKVAELRIMNNFVTDAWAATSYNNLSSPGTFFTIGSTETKWYDTDWSYRVKITVLASKVDADLEDYPVYVDLSDLPSGFHNHVNQTDARDVRVTLDDGITEVPREVVFYTAASDTGELHFKADVDSDYNTDFYIYYGNSEATEPAVDSTYGAENVWNSNYKGVWHMNNTSDTTVKDSTSNEYTGTKLSTGNPLEDTGKMGKAQSFSSDRLSMGDVLDIGTNDVTMSQWIKATDTSSAAAHCMAKAKADSTQYRYSARIATDGGAGFFMAGSSGSIIYESDEVVDDDTWHHFVVVLDRSGNGEVFVDGESVGTSSISTYNGQDFQSVCLFWIGAYPNSDNSTIYSGFPGLIDESRISFVTLTSTWISTEYNNQSAPDDFFTIGSEESNVDSNIKSIINLVYASVKSVNGLAMASVKSINSLN